MPKIPKVVIKRRIKNMKFLFKRRPKKGTISKITPLSVVVYVNDVTVKPNVVKRIPVYSEVHSSLQDLVATLFRRGIVDAKGTIYTGGSIVKVVPTAETLKAQESKKQEEVSKVETNDIDNIDTDTREKLEAEA